MIKCLKAAMLCAILVTAAPIAAYAADPTPRQTQTPPQVAKPLDFRWPLDAAYATAVSLMPLSLALRMARIGLSTATSTGIEPISPPSKEVRPTPHGGGAGYCPRV